MDPNLQGWWKLESDGSDSSPNGYDLSATGTISHVAGTYGSAADFESINGEYYSIDNASCPNLEVGGDQTWLGWFNPDGAPGSSYGLMGKRDGVPIKQILQQFTNVVRVRWDGLSDNIMDTSATLVPGSWNFVCARFDQSAGTVTIWIGTATIEFASSGTMSDTDGVFSIGTTFGGNNAFNGLADEVRFYDRALTDSEVTSLYETNALPATGDTNVVRMLV